MPTLRIGSKKSTKNVNLDGSSNKTIHDHSSSEHITSLEAKIIELQSAPAKIHIKYIDVINEVEVIKEVKVIEERIVEKQVQVIHEFPVFKETIVKEFVDRPYEVIKEVEKEIIKQVKYIPQYIYGVCATEALVIILLILFK